MLLGASQNPPGSRAQPPTTSPSVPHKSPGRGGRRLGLGVLVGVLALALVAGITRVIDVGWDDLVGAVRNPVSATPVQVNARELPEGVKVQRIAVGSSSACLLAAGEAYCWGSNADGQLGREGGSASRPAAVDTSGALAGRTLVDLAVGAQHVCALDAERRAFCWGDNSEGQLGTTGWVSSSSTPLSVARAGALAGRELAFVAAGGSTTCALDTLGEVACWGANDRGQLGNGTTQPSSEPVRVGTSADLAGGRVTALGVGDHHACAIVDSREAYCWGANDHGQLGNGGTSDALVPTRVQTDDALVRLTMDGNTTCARRSVGRHVCWGAGERGQLGGGTFADSAVPVPIELTKVAKLNVGDATTCAIRENRTLHCWGAGDLGQRGTGERTDSAESSRVREPDVEWTQVNAGPSTVCGVDTLGHAWCWGSDRNGQLGDG